MKNYFKIALAALAVAGMGSAASADLTYNGAVGLPLNPTAQVPQQNGARVQLNYLKAAEDADIYSLGGAVRIGNSPFEVNGSINQLRVDEGTDDIGFSIGAKYLFSRETDPAKVRLAAGLGFERLSAFDTDYDNTFGYLVASKYLTQAIDGRIPVVGHLGVRWDKFEAGGFDDDKFSIYGGVEVPLTRKGDFRVVGELGTERVEDGEMPYSVGLRYRAANQPFGATIGLARHGVFGDDAELFAQLGYTFDTK